MFKVKDPLITEEMIIQRYLQTGAKKEERAVREVWRVLKEFIKKSSKTHTKINIGSRLTLFSDLYLKSDAEKYEGEDLQYLMNDLYCDKWNKYDSTYVMNSKYRENNIEEIVEDVENFFKNPPFKNKKTKKQ